MDKKRIKILLLDGDVSTAELIQKMAGEIPETAFEIHCANRLEAGLKQLNRDIVDVIFLNLSLPDSQGIATLIKLKDQVPGIPIIVLSDRENKDMGVMAIHEGAQDYLLKTALHPGMLSRVISYALERNSLEKEMLRHYRELKDMKLKYQAILLSTPNGLCIINPHWKILWANMALNRILYPGAMSSLGMEYESFSVLFPKQDVFEAFVEKVRQSLTISEIHIEEAQLIKGDGIVFPAEIYIVRINPAETGGGFVATITDLTARKKAEAALKKAQQELIQSEKLSSLGRFASGIAHEIRNPLGNIVASAQYCLSKKEGQNSLIREYLEIILRNAENANKIIKLLFDFAKPRSVNLRPADIEKVIKRACDSVKGRCSQQHIRLTCNVPRQYPPILIDDSSLEEAFSNLITNALDAMPQGGDLTLTAYMDLRSQDIVVKFRDTGKGIPPENMDKIFEPFFTTKENGVGLGMSLVHQIVKYHGGRIALQTKVGEFTEVEVRFPICEKEILGS
jgi:PAS domain S-box-containing protein